MASPWSRLRTAQHFERYPPEERAERNRLAQARYRQRHAKRQAEVRAISSILMRQRWYAADVKRLAAALRAMLGRSGIAALRKQLGR